MDSEQCPGDNIKVKGLLWGQNNVLKPAPTQLSRPLVASQHFLPYNISKALQKRSNNHEVRLTPSHLNIFSKYRLISIHWSRNQVGTILEPYPPQEINP